MTTYKTETYMEPVTTYRTSYYYEPVTTVRYSTYYDPCSGCPSQVATPVTSYRLRSQCSPVTSYLQRTACKPVTSYQMAYYWEPQTTCCQTTIGASGLHAADRGCCSAVRDLGQSRWSAAEQFTVRRTAQRRRHGRQRSAEGDGQQP